MGNIISPINDFILNARAHRPLVCLLPILFVRCFAVTEELEVFVHLALAAVSFSVFEIRLQAKMHEFCFFFVITGKMFTRCSPGETCGI